MDPSTTSRTYRPLRRVEYEQLIASGAFDRERIELVNGRLVTMSQQGTRHIAVVERTASLLQRQVSAGYRVLRHSPLSLGELSMPEPDVSVTPVAPDTEYPKDAILVVEVSDSSLKYDRGEKMELYAAERVPVYWLVDLVHDQIRVHSQPAGGGEEAVYRTVVTLERGDVLRLESVPGLEIAVDEVLGSVRGRASG